MINKFDMISEAIRSKYDENVSKDLISNLNNLIDRETFLCALEAAGVDNWSGYEYAYEILEEWEKEDE